MPGEDSGRSVGGSDNVNGVDEFPTSPTTDGAAGQACAQERDASRADLPLKGE
jgi:hypothetical protein